MSRGTFLLSPLAHWHWSNKGKFQKDILVYLDTCACLQLLYQRWQRPQPQPARVNWHHRWNKDTCLEWVALPILDCISTIPKALIMEVEDSLDFFVSFIPSRLFKIPNVPAFQAKCAGPLISECKIVVWNKNKLLGGGGDDHHSCIHVSFIQALPALTYLNYLRRHNWKK